MADYAIPKRVSFDRLTDIIGGWYRVGAHKEGKRTSDVEEETGITNHVGRQNEFLVSIGILSKEGYDRKLTEEGYNLAEALVIDDVPTAKSEMRSLLENWDFTDLLKRYFKANEPIDQDSLSKKVCDIVGKDPEGKTTGVHALIDTYEWAGVIELNESGEYTLSKEKKKTEEGKKTEPQEEKTGELGSSKEQELARSDEVNSKPPERQVLRETEDAQFQINLNLSGEENPEKVAKLIKRIRVALEKDMDEIEIADKSHSGEGLEENQDDAEDANQGSLADFDS